MNVNHANPEDFDANLRSCDEAVIVAQEIVQRGAIHALTTLLERGCSVDNAKAMLDSLNANLAVIERIRSERFVVDHDR